MDADDFLSKQAADDFLSEDDEPGQPKKRRLIEELLDRVTEALDSATEGLSSGKQSTADVVAGLEKLTKAIAARKSDTPVSALTDAIKSLRDITVNVSPTPITVAAPVVQILERVKPGAYEMRFTYDRDDRLETAVLVPLAAIPKEKKPLKMFGGGE